MAGIRTAIELTDRMTAPLRSITNALNLTIHSFENMQSSVNNSFNVRQFDGAKVAIDEANSHINAMTSNIRESSIAQSNFNSKVAEGSQGLEAMGRNVMSIVGAYAGFRGIQKAVNLSDTYTQTTARLNLMNDGLQTTEELQQKIFNSAQRSRASYLDTTQVISKLGLLAKNAFSNNDEMIGFAELMNKQFKIGGASLQEQTSAMYQLTQAMASGRLQGDEYRSIIENAPLLAKSIEDYMINVKKVKGTMKDWASDGLLTANVIKSAMFRSAEEVNKTFATMPRTWGEVWTSISNRLLIAMSPILKVINKLAQNWEILEPIVIAGAVALGSYILALTSLGTISTIISIKEGIRTARTMIQTGATISATIAQHGLNTALLACPITWIIAGVVAVIGIFYAVIAVINKFQGTSLSATGMIVGAFFTLWAVIKNVFFGITDILAGFFNYLVNPFIRFVNFVYNLFKGNWRSAIINFISDTISNILGMFEKLATAMDRILGTKKREIFINLQNDLQKKTQEAIVKFAPDDNYKRLINPMNLGGKDLLGLKNNITRSNYGESYKKGFDFGNSIANNQTENYLKNIDINTGKTADSIYGTVEELEYMRSLAEQQAINKFTTAEIKIEQTNHNNLNQGADVDGIMDRLTKGLSNAIEMSAEGVY